MGFTGCTGVRTRAVGMLVGADGSCGLLGGVCGDDGRCPKQSRWWMLVAVEAWRWWELHTLPGWAARAALARTRAVNAATLAWAVVGVVAACGGLCMATVAQRAFYDPSKCRHAQVLALPRDVQRYVPRAGGGGDGGGAAHGAYCRPVVPSAVVPCVRPPARLTLPFALLSCSWQRASFCSPQLFD